MPDTPKTVSFKGRIRRTKEGWVAISSMGNLTTIKFLSYKEGLERAQHPSN